MTQEGTTMRSLNKAATAAICLFSGMALAQAAEKPTDPQIAHIAYTAGELDITAAKQAIAKSKNKEVRAFAQDMLRDHEAVNKQALALVTKLHVTPADNDTSRALTKAENEKQAKLAKLHDAAYDKAYIANEVAYHKQVNHALEALLIPSAENAELKKRSKLASGSSRGTSSTPKRSPPTWMGGNRPGDDREAGRRPFFLARGDLRDDARHGALRNHSGDYS
jgi:putative membrane protein